MPVEHDGTINNDGPIAEGRGPHGGEDHFRDAHVQTGQATDGGIRLHESDNNAFAR